ncbi:MAG: N4-gp56 family major capsid protein [Ignavibacteriae bacterium]|nr:N4-gp56 family major capsid protein [Ignavibacteriota bacterium]
MPNIGKSQIANVNAFYDKNFLSRALPLLVHSRWAQIRDIPRNNSDVIKFRKYNSLSVATTPLSEGVTPAGSALSVTDSTATVLQYGDFVTLTDKLKMETEDPVETEATDILGEQAAETFETLDRDILAAGTTIQYASTATQRTDITAAMKLTAAEIREAVRTLKNNKAKRITRMVDPQTGYNTTPVDACYIGIVHPNSTYDLKSDSAFVPIEKYAAGLKGGPLPGEVGKLDEVRFVETTLAKVFTGGGSGGADVYATLIIGQDAYGVTRISGEAMKIIRKQLGTGGTTDPLDQRSTIGWKGTRVTKILQQLFMLRLEHGVTA